MPETSIGLAGKEVRCKACGERWHVRGEAATPDTLELEDLQDNVVGSTAQVAAPAPVGSKTMKAKRARFGGARSKPVVLEEPELILEDDEPGLVAATPRTSAATAMRELGYQTKHKGRMKRIRAVWLVALVLILTALAAAVLLRQAVVEANPGAAGLYGALGMNVSPTGLDVSLSEARQVRLDGMDYLIVEGVVENISSTKRFAPMVELRLTSPGGDTLASWGVDTGPRPLAPGELRDYRTEYPNPPVDAATLTYTLDAQQ